MSPSANPLASSEGTRSLFKNASQHWVKRRRLADRLTRWLVMSGGLLIIAAILAIFIVILSVVYPLLKSPQLTSERSFSFSGKGEEFLAVGADEYREIAYSVTQSGVHFYSIKNVEALPAPDILMLQGARIAAVAKSKGHFLALGLTDGRVVPARVRFDVSFPDGKRQVDAALEVQDPILIKKDEPIATLAIVAGDGELRIATAGGSNEITVVILQERQTMMGTTLKKEFRKHFAVPAKGAITALAMHSDRNDLLVGTASGQILKVELGDPDDEEVLVDVVGATPKENIGVSALAFLSGGQTLVVGDESGGIKSYQFFGREDGRFKITEIHSFLPHDEAVTVLSVSQRDKGFITGDHSGTLRYHFGTTGTTQFTLSQREGSGVNAAVLTPKVDGLLSMDASGRVSHWAIDNPHPEISWQSLFGKMHYESYPEPEYVWQSTGGTDDFEPKISLMPLIYGTLKGTFYALLFAVPLAVFGAFYASQFMHPLYKNIVKPVVEIMATLPSVVLGFMAALWLAPRVETFLPGLLISPFVIVALVLLFLLAKETWPQLLPASAKPGTEIFVLIFLVILGCGLGFYLGSAAESAFLQDGYKRWINEVLGLSYDQRNSLVVGIAMGFAVIPLIFTLAEDSLSNVPGHLRAGSLALGATQWQTAINVILPTASPGIFSAIMIGFGRAVGETMIVLMATGNTPIMEANIFSGFRALAANIAVELPEAPEGGTLFRTLFLAAFILFMLTFFINTFAEWVRLRLREKYRVL